MKKICFVTGTRAEYGLLHPLMQLFKEDSNWRLQLVVTGMHLSPEFGLTFQAIEADDYVIDEKIEMLLSSDSSVGVVKSTGLGMIGFADALDRLQPDLMVVLGDRYEILAAATAAFIMRIPIAHLSGGETTEGAFDEGLRHAITKMSYLHFTAAKAYQDRVIQLGEDPSRVYNVGGLGVDNIINLPKMTKEELEKSIGFKFNATNILVTYHPVTLENSSTLEQLSNLFDALDTFPEVGIIFTKANSDNEGRQINQRIDAYVAKNSHRAISFTSLGQNRYLNTMRYVDGVVGNSSSGIAEAPSMKVGTLNIGDRQKGRLMADSVLQVNSDRESIIVGLREILSEKFKHKLRNVRSPFGEGNTAPKIYSILCQLDLTDIKLKKKFYAFE